MSRPFPALMSNALRIFWASPTYRQRFSYYKHGKMREENEFLHKCLHASNLEDMDPEDVEFLSICVMEIELAIALLIGGDREQCISDMREAIPIDGETASRLRQLGKCL